VTSIRERLRRRFGDAGGESGDAVGPEQVPEVAGDPAAGRSAPAESPPAAAAPLPPDSRPAEADDREDVLARLRRRIAALDKKWKDAGPDLGVAARRAEALEMLPGRVLDTADGKLRVVSETLPRGTGHGRYPIGGFADDPARLEALALLYRLRAAPRPERLVFLDTETTGLAGGAGTLPFLVGLAWLDGGDVHLEQLFLDHPRDEAALVAHLRERLARFDHAVTYNGRAFDVPLLQNRFVLHRTPWPELETSLDLLPGARRLHRRHLDDRSLGSIERNVLGFHRDDDVPGSEIPGIYHRFLLTGRPERLADVVRHNAWDVVAMAALLGLQAGLLAAPDAEHGLDPGVDLALGELRYARHDFAAAVRHLERAVRRAEPLARRPAAGDVWVESLVWLARAHRRQGRHEESAACWRRILAVLPDHGVAHLGLAKHLEHRTREYARAEFHALAAAEAGAEGQDEAWRRVERVRGKRGSCES
jgi:uncharacterized protein YprB with RNaseH-like and TPR domain